MTKSTSMPKGLRALSFVLTLALALTFFPSGALNPMQVEAAGYDATYNLNSGPVVVPNSVSDVLITGSVTVSNKHGIEVQSGFQGTITLQNVNVQTNTHDDYAAMLIGYNSSYTSATNQATTANTTKVELILDGNNTLYSHSAGSLGNGSKKSVRAGLEVWKGAQVHIRAINEANDASGTLTARSTASPSSNSPDGGGAGIGQGDVDGSGGDIIISSGTINAYAGYHGAGIGGAGYNKGAGVYNGNILIYGGVINSYGGGHGSGIGGGCRNNFYQAEVTSGTIVVLPPTDINANSAGSYPKVGSMHTKVYIGDTGSPLVTVKTSENTTNADIFMDLRNITTIPTVLTKLGILTSEVDPSRITFGNTGSSGTATLKMESGTGNNVNFYTDVNTSGGLKFLAVEQAITAATTITLPAPIFKFTTTTSPATVSPLIFGYTAAQATANAITVTIKNEGNSPVTNLTAVLDAATAAKYDIIGTGLSATTLAVNATATIALRPKLGLDAGTHTPTIVINGDGVSGTGASQTLVPMTAVNVTGASQVVNKGTGGTGNGGSVAASPQPDSNEHNYTQVTLTTSTSSDNTIVSWQYVISTSPTAPGSGWITGTGTSQTVSFPAADTTYYIHWKVENSNYTDTSGTITNGGVSTYILDRRQPEVSSITTIAGVSAAGDDPFDVEITFDEDVSMLALAGLTVNNATASNLVRTATNKFKVTLTAAYGLTSGNFITMNVNANAVTDAAGNGNKASSASGTGFSITFSTDTPIVSSWSFTAGQKYTAQLASVNLTINPRGQSDKSLKLNGTQLAVGNAATFVTVSGPGGPYTATVTAVDPGTGFVTVTVTGPFDSGDYTVTVTGTNLKNAEGNALITVSRAFKVQIPKIPTGAAGMTVSPVVHATYAGGVTTVTVKGEYFNSAGTLTVDMLRPDGTTVPLTSPAISGGDTANSTATFTVNIGPNTKTTAEIYTFTPVLNGTPQTGTTGTSTIPAATPGIDAGAGGFNVAPTSHADTGGNSTITVKGVNMHNYTGLKVVRKLGGVVDSTFSWTVSPSAGAQTYTKTAAHPANTTAAIQNYTYHLVWNNGGVETELRNATVTVNKSTPTITDFKVKETATSSEGLAVSYPYTGGTASFVIRGTKMNAFHTIEVREGSVVKQPFNPTVADASQISFTLGHGPNTSDIAQVHTYELYVKETAASSFVKTSYSVKVTLSGEPRVSAVTVPATMTQMGGAITVNVSGVNLNQITGKQVTVEVWMAAGSAARTLVETKQASVLSDTSAVLAYSIPRNKDNDEKTYYFVAKAPVAGGTDKEGATKIEAAKPQILPPSGKDSALAANPTFVDNIEANYASLTPSPVKLTAYGVNLHNYASLEARYTDAGGTQQTVSFNLSGLDADDTFVETTVQIPFNATLNNIDYIFELWAQVSSGGTASNTTYTAKVTAEGAYPKVTKIEASPAKFSSSGGTATIKLTGQYLNLAGTVVEVQDYLGYSWPRDTWEYNNKEDVTLKGTIASDGRTATLTMTFSGNTRLRNDLHKLRPIVNGTLQEDTVYCIVEVGDSIAHIESAAANPVSLTTEQAKSNGRPNTTAEIISGHLLDSSNGPHTLQIYDVLQDVWHTVTINDNDFNTLPLTVPSNSGSYEYHVYFDGQHAETFHVYVGVPLGYCEATGDDGNNGQIKVPEDPKKREIKDKNWTGRGVGAKGGTWSGGWQWDQFDMLYHNARQAVKVNPDNAFFTLQDVWLITQAQLNRAAVGSRADARSNSVTIHFDTIDPENSSIVEGRMFIKPADTRFVENHLYPMVFTREELTAGTRKLFLSRYDNSNIEVIRLSQVGDYCGIEVEIAANPELDDFDTDNLYFYLYIPESGEFEQMDDMKYGFDDADYIHIFTKKGGDLVITDEPLTLDGTKVTKGQFEVETEQ